MWNVERNEKMCESNVNLNVRVIGIECWVIQRPGVRGNPLIRRVNRVKRTHEGEEMRGIGGFD